MSRSDFWRRLKRAFVVDPIADLREWAERNTRPAYFPRVSDGEGAPAGSRFNGRPFLLEGEAQPACAVCAKPMPLFLQLDLGALPGDYAGRFGDGLLQLFYCPDECEHADGDAWEPWVHKSKLVRVVPHGAAGALAGGEAGVPAKPIVGWDARPDRCNVEEAEQHGLERKVEFLEGGIHRTRFICAAMDIDTGWIDSRALQNAIHEKVFNPANRDKLGGWPYWVQGVEYPSCPQCGSRMQLVFQIDSEDHVPHMFGDVGCGHITQCPRHKHVVTFAWACH